MSIYMFVTYITSICVYIYMKQSSRKWLQNFKSGYFRKKNLADFRDRKIS